MVRTRKLTISNVSTIFVSSPCFAGRGRSEDAVDCGPVVVFCNPNAGRQKSLNSRHKLHAFQNLMCAGFYECVKYQTSWIEYYHSRGISLQVEKVFGRIALFDRQIL